MSIKEKLKEAIIHPITALAVVVSAVGQIGVGWFEPVWALVSGTASLWFPAVATTGATILPELGYQSVGTTILLASAVVYVGVQLDRLVSRLQKRLQ